MIQINKLVKCNIRNRLTSAGYIAFLGSLVLIVIENKYNFRLSVPSEYLAIFGGVSLGLGDFGFGTYSAYRRTLKHIEKFNRLDKRYVQKHKWYCQKVGIQIASEETGLEKIVLI